MPTNPTDAVTIHCVKCGCVSRHLLERKAFAIQHTTHLHDEGCPFMAAVQCGKGPEWVNANGYPLDIKVEEVQLS